MSRKQLWFAYAVVCFLLIWGLDLVNSIKFEGSIAWNEVISPFHASQLIYAISTFWLTRLVFQKFYRTKKFAALALSILGLILAFIFIRFTLEEVLYPLLFNLKNYPENVRILYYALDNVYYALIYITLGTLIFLFDHQLRTQK